MTAQELIDDLRTFPPDAEVFFSGNDLTFDRPIGGVHRGKVQDADGLHDVVIIQQLEYPMTEVLLR